MPDTDWSRPVRRDCDKMFPPRHRGSGLPRALAPSPAKAGEGWGGVLLGSTRTVSTPSQPPPAFAGGGPPPDPPAYGLPLTRPTAGPNSQNLGVGTVGASRFCSGGWLYHYKKNNTRKHTKNKHYKETS